MDAETDLHGRQMHTHERRGWTCRLCDAAAIGARKGRMRRSRCVRVPIDGRAQKCRSDCDDTASGARE